MLGWADGTITGALHEHRTFTRALWQACDAISRVKNEWFACMWLLFSYYLNLHVVLTSEFSLGESFIFCVLVSLRCKSRRYWRKNRWSGRVPWELAWSLDSNIPAKLTEFNTIPLCPDLQRQIAIFTQGLVGYVKAWKDIYLGTIVYIIWRWPLGAADIFVSLIVCQKRSLICQPMIKPKARLVKLAVTFSRVCRSVGVLAHAAVAYHLVKHIHFCRRLL